ncbi:MAG: aminotransferase class III-fold pyridoxal phosphate-dependent enzyme [Muribaculaceae bacterium]|nr:aminotransferase class III-fold pyridoxal phosphate-dependent enzyme [Muribaculaceae bacterium]
MELFDVYSLFHVEPVRGMGSYVYTEDSTPYLDLYGGHAVISIGHSHPKYVKAVTDQLSKLGFYSNSVENSLQKKLAKKLGDISGYDSYNLFLCNSGAEANENAIKLASFTTGRKKILAFRKAFHGRTSGAVGATDNEKIQAPFNKTENVSFVPLNDLDAVKRELESGDFAAVIIEGIQGVAGINMPEEDFLVSLEKLCKETGTLLILDEIQSGYGRTGKFFAHQYSGIKPDIITVAKGIANGFPFAAVLISPEIEAKKGMLGTTFGGNHLGCAAALAVIDVIEEENLIQNAAEIGEFLKSELKKIPEIEDVRGRGLMIGFEVKGFSGSEIRKRLLFEKHIFTGGAGEKTIRLLPALSISKSQALEFIEALKSIISSK